MKKIIRFIVPLTIILICIALYLSYDSLNIKKYGIDKVRVTDFIQENYQYEFYFSDNKKIDAIVNKMNNICLKKRKNYTLKGSMSHTGSVSFYYTDGTVLHYEIYGGEAIFETNSKIWYESKSYKIIHDDLTEFFEDLR